MSGRFVAMLLLAILHLDAYAQKLNYDPRYIEDHTTDLTARIFSGYKFSGYKLDQRGFSKPLTFKSNNSISVGLGFNYRFLGFNLAIKTPLIGNDNTRLGKTKMVDLQTYLYLRRFTLDLYGQFYTGYYVRDGSIWAIRPPENIYIIRNDLKTRSIGINAQYIFNYRRFSYRAAYLQNEIQKKSSGSAIAGIGIHYYSASADSAIIPRNIVDGNFFNSNSFNKSTIFCMSVNLGYAQTFIIHHHFFVTGAAILGIGVNKTALTDEEQDTKNSRSGMQLNATFRLAAGYNKGNLYIGAQYIDFLSRNAAPYTDSWQEYETGNLKLTVAYRFPIKRNFIKEANNALGPIVN